MTEPFYGNFDLASLTLWLFWIFFALLIYYLQTENMREGYPMEADDGTAASNQGPFPLPKGKTFKLRNGRGEVTYPDMQREARDVALEKVGPGNGFPLEPTGDPMADGVGPASWAPRRDEPEVDAEGHNKIRPMGSLPEFFISAGTDPRGLPVVAGDDIAVGEVTEIWIDAPEQMIRYLTVTLDDEKGDRLLPMTLARVRSDRILVHSIYAGQFPGVPTTASDSQITMLEEEKICGYYGGGKLYADPARQESQL